MRVTIFGNPFDLSQVVTKDFPQTTIAEWVAANCKSEAEIAVVVIDGQRVPREQWDEPCSDSTISIMLKPRGVETALFWVSIALAVVSIATIALIPRPKTPKDNQVSPTYSLGAQENTARLGMPVPVQYGRNRIWPDLLTQPFNTYQNNDQYVFQMFCLGQGEFDLEDLKIDDTSVSSFDEIQYEYYYNQPVTLFPTDVATSSEPANQELITSYTGPFVASPPATTGTRLEVDIIWQSGLFVAQSSGDTTSATTTVIIQYRLIDDAGSPLGGWVTNTENVKDATRSPKRVTFGYDVASGRYEVQVERGEAGVDGPTTFTKAVWEGLRAYLDTDVKTYTGVTVLAVKAKATGNLNSSSSRKFNLIATRKIPVLDSNGGWTSPVATSAIAWALADIIRANYGADRADAYIDIDRLVQLHTVWEERGDQFNYRFDTTTTLWDALKVAARAGRAFPIMNNQVISFVRSAAQTIPSTIFNRANTASFQVEYSLINPEDPDSILAEYVDPSRGWQPYQVLCQPVGSAAANPKRVQYFGVTNRAQAFREGIYDAQCFRVQRKQARFNTELEGYIPNRGDLVIVANEDFKYTQGGDVIAVSGLSIFTSEPLQWDSNTSFAMRFRKQDGSADGPHIVHPGSADNEAVLNDPLGWTPYIGGSAERTKYQFGEIGSVLVEWIVSEISPRGGNLVEMLCVNEDDSVHTADEAPVPPDDVPAPIATNDNAPVIRTFLVEYLSDPTVLNLAWTHAPGAESYVVQQRIAIDSNTFTDWVTIYTGTSTQITIAAPAGFIELQVAGIGNAKGPWKEWDGLVGQYIPHSPTDLTLTSILILAADSQYHSQITFSFTAPPSDYHILTFEAQYKYPYHDDWQPLYNALETSHIFSTPQLGTIHVRVRSVYIQGNTYSDWAETTIDNLGTYTAVSAIGLSDPIDPKLFVTLDIENNRVDIRISVGYDATDVIAAEKFILFYSLDDIPNQLVLGTDAGSKLYMKSVAIEGSFNLNVLAGSSTVKVNYSDPTDLVDIDLSGIWWFRVVSGTSGNTKYYKIIETDDTAVYINTADPLPFTPQVGDTIQVIEVGYHDSRLPEFSLAYVDGEVIKHNGINFDSGLSLYYLDVVTRGAEGTTQAVQTGKTLNYFPAFGADTKIVEIPMQEFSVADDGSLTYSGNLPVLFPAKFSWAAVTGCFVRTATSSETVAYVRSIIVPLTNSGPA